MACEVEVTDEFTDWWVGLSEQEQNSVTAITEILAERGAQVPYPYSSQIKGSRHSHMRELRILSGAHPLRVFYAFDPRRTAILLIGGDKTGNDRFYKEFNPVADALYDVHLLELKKEGLI